MVPNRQQAFIWTNDGLGWWRIYSWLGLNELIFPNRCIDMTFLPPQPSGLEGYCRHVPGGRSGGQLPNLRNPYLCNRLMDFLHSKFCGIAYACSCSLSWSITHLLRMGLPMGLRLVKFATNLVQTLRIAYLGNRWMGVPHLKFHWLVLTCSRHCHSYLPICSIWVCPWAKILSNIQHLGQTLRNPYLWNRWMDIYHSKFYGIV